MKHAPEPDVTAIVVCRDDEERVGHLCRRLAAHLHALHLRGEILVCDELSGDNTLSLLGLLRRDLPELRVLAGVSPGQGFVQGARAARGRALVLVDARCEAPFSALGFALSRLADGWDAMAVHGRYLVLRRSRTEAAFASLHHRRDAHDLERRFLRRAGALALKVDRAGGRPPRPTPWHRLRDAVLVPLASRAWF